MAGAGGTAPKPQPQEDPRITQLREDLIPHLREWLNRPEPQAPQYQPAPVSPLQSIAMDRNPQTAGMLYGQIQAPAQARYMQQQEMFKNAMEGRQQAQAGALNLLNQSRLAQESAQERQDRLNAEAAHEAHLTEQEKIDWYKAKHPAAAQAAEIRGNGPAKPPNLQVVNNILATKKVMGELDNMEKILDQAWSTQSTGQRMLGAQLTHTKEGESPGFLARVGGYVNPLAGMHEAARQRIVTELGPLLTNQNRAIASIAARIEKSLPDIGTNPIVYKRTISDLRNLAKEIDSTQRTAYPRESQMADSGGQSAQPQYGIPRSKFDSLPPDEQKRATDAGVQIIEGR